MREDEQGEQWVRLERSDSEARAEGVADEIPDEQRRMGRILGEVVAERIRQQREGRTDEGLEAAKASFEARASAQYRRVLAEVTQGEEQSSRSMRMCRFKG